MARAKLAEHAHDARLRRAARLASIERVIEIRPCATHVRAVVVHEIGAEQALAKVIDGLDREPECRRQRLDGLTRAPIWARKERDGPIDSEFPRERSRIGKPSRRKRAVIPLAIWTVAMDDAGRAREMLRFRVPNQQNREFSLIVSHSSELSGTRRAMLQSSEPE